MPCLLLCIQCFHRRSSICVRLFWLHLLVSFECQCDLGARNTIAWTYSSGCMILIFITQIGRRTFKIKRWQLSGSSCINMHWFSFTANNIGYWNLKLEILLLDAQFRASVSLFYVVVCSLSFSFLFFFPLYSSLSSCLTSFRCICRSIFHVDQLQNGCAQWRWM